jgi:hypothetical protein
MTLIKGIATGATMLIVLSAPSAQAGYVVHLTEQGSNVVATGKGPIDLTGLSPVGLFFLLPALEPSAGIIQTGLSNLAHVYLGVTGPANFGSGGITGATSGSGDVVGIPAPSLLFVPDDYISDDPLSDTATYLNQTFNSLGVTPGTYEWTWGSGPNQNFTLVAGVPETSTWAMMLIGFAGLGFLGYQSAGPRRRTARNA